MITWGTFVQHYIVSLEKWCNISLLHTFQWSLLTRVTKKGHHFFCLNCCLFLLKIFYFTLYSHMQDFNIAILSAEFHRLQFPVTTSIDGLRTIFSIDINRFLAHNIHVHDNKILIHAHGDYTSQHQHPTRLLIQTSEIDHHSSH